MSVQIKGVGTIGGIDQGLDTVGVVTATSFVGTGVSVVGVITATSFVGSGANLTGITGTTINNNAANRIVTGSGSANTLEANSNFTYTGSVVTHSNPSGLAKLDVKGDVSGGALGASISVRNTNSANNGSGEFQFQDPGSNIFAKIAGVNLTDGSNNGYMTFHTSSATSGLVERLRITDSGKIGQYISSPSYDFHSYKSSGTVRGRLQTNGTSGSDYADMVVQAGGGNYIQQFIYGTGFGYMNGSASQSMSYGNIANAPVYFSTNNISRALFDTSGNLQIIDGNLKINSAGNGIDFSATSDTSGSTSELFDDYEEGSFSPNIKGTSGAGTASYSTRTGRYTKVGNFVHITFEINWSSGSAGGELRVTDLPFVPTTDYEGIGSCMFHTVYLHGNEGLCVYVGPGVNYTYFYQSRSNDSWHSVNYDSAGVVIGNVSYRTS